MNTAPLGDDHALLVWWPQLKQQMSTMTHTLNRQYRHNTQLPQQVQSAEAVLRQAFAAAEQQPSDAIALQQVLQARQAFTRAMATSALPAEVASKYSWLLLGERPSPLITKLTRPPRAARWIPALNCVGCGTFSTCSNWGSGGQCILHAGTYQSSRAASTIAAALCRSLPARS